MKVFKQIDLTKGTPWKVILLFSLPILLLFVDGKETLRIGRNFDILEFKNSIHRYYNMIF